MQIDFESLLKILLIGGFALLSLIGQLARKKQLPPPDPGGHSPIPGGSTPDTDMSLAEWIEHMRRQAEREREMAEAEARQRSAPAEEYRHSTELSSADQPVPDTSSETESHSHSGSEAWTTQQEPDVYVASRTPLPTPAEIQYDRIEAPVDEAFSGSSGTKSVSAGQRSTRAGAKTIVAGDDTSVKLRRLRLDPASMRQAIILAAVLDKPRSLQLRPKIGRTIRR